MCLIPLSPSMMQQGRGDCCSDLFKPTIHPTKDALWYQFALKILLGIHLFIGVIKTIIIGFDSSFYDFACCMILYCGLTRLDYYYTLMYLLFDLAINFFNLVSLGLYVQMYYNSKSKTPHFFKIIDKSNDSKQA